MPGQHVIDHGPVLVALRFAIGPQYLLNGRYQFGAVFKAQFFLQEIRLNSLDFRIGRAGNRDSILVLSLLWTVLCVSDLTLSIDS